MTWAISSEVMEEIAGPRVWKASFQGAKKVAFWVVESRGSLSAA
jgi:hypothetical protein